MGHLDPSLMRMFRGMVYNPQYYPSIYQTVHSYSYDDLKSPTGAYGMIDELCSCCGVTLTTEQRDNAAEWLMNCDIDPHNPYHRRRMWNMVRGSDDFWF